MLIIESTEKFNLSVRQAADKSKVVKRAKRVKYERRNSKVFAENGNAKKTQKRCIRSNRF